MEGLKSEAGGRKIARSTGSPALSRNCEFTAETRAKNEPGRLP